MREATNVEVLFRDVLATECQDLPVVIAEERELGGRERAALEPFFSRGGQIERVVPKMDRAEAIQPLVDRLIEAIHTSPAVHRLPEDPLAVVEARREGVLQKGRVVVRAGALTEVEMKPAYSIFP